MKKLIVDVTIKASDSDHWKGQSETSGTLSRLGIHKRRWMMGSSNGKHKWRCWITEEQLTAATLIAESVNLDFNAKLQAKQLELQEKHRKLESKMSLLDAVLNGDTVDFDELQELLNG